MPAAMMHGGGGCAVHDDDKVRITGNKQQTQKSQNKYNQRTLPHNHIQHNQQHKINSKNVLDNQHPAPSDKLTNENQYF